CPNGYFGFSCEKACPYPYYGEKCLHTCQCSRLACNISYGCTRFTGYTGSQNLFSTLVNDGKHDPYIGFLSYHITNITVLPLSNISVTVTSKPRSLDNLLLTAILFAAASVMLVVALPLILYCVLNKKTTLFKKNDYVSPAIIAHARNDAQQNTNEYETLGYQMLFQGVGNLSIWYDRRKESYSINVLSSRDICDKEEKPQRMASNQTIEINPLIAGDQDNAYVLPNNIDTASSSDVHTFNDEFHATPESDSKSTNVYVTVIPSD
ncbi:uncharacterized protein LOC134272360, partial [Saccostrea cucullata]